MFSDKELIEIIPKNMIFISYFGVVLSIILFIQLLCYIVSSTIY
jgi:hypothetical protein